MTTRVWKKPYTQLVIKQIRRCGHIVRKEPAGYVATTREGKEIFRAMNGHNGYLVRYDDEYIKHAAEQ